MSSPLLSSVVPVQNQNHSVSLIDYLLFLPHLSKRSAVAHIAPDPIAFHAAMFIYFDIPRREAVLMRHEDIPTSSSRLPTRFCVIAIPLWMKPRPLTESPRESDPPRTQRWWKIKPSAPFIEIPKRGYVLTQRGMRTEHSCGIVLISKLPPP
jgi:hypothetical protein